MTRLECHLWVVRLPLEADRAHAYEQLKALAKPEDAARSDKFLRLDDKLRSLISRLLPRIILRDVIQLTEALISIKTESKGRPYLEPPLGWDRVFDFNCTHDHDLVCCGYLTGPFSNANASARIGVDVMKLTNPFPDCSPAEMLETLKDQLDETEIADIQRFEGTAQVREMLRYWTHKEALVKATGEGVGVGLQRYRLSFGEQTDLLEDGAAASSWRFYEQIIDEHLIVVALHLPGYGDALPNLEPQIRMFDMATFINNVKRGTG